MSTGAIMLTAGLVLLAYAGWALYSGWIVVTWATTVYRPSALYWITVGSLLLAGGLNVFVGANMLLRG